MEGKSSKVNPWVQLIIENQYLMLDVGLDTGCRIYIQGDELYISTIPTISTKFIINIISTISTISTLSTISTISTISTLSTISI